jgi:hypothetical protein
MDTPEKKNNFPVLLLSAALVFAVLIIICLAYRNFKLAGIKIVCAPCPVVSNLPCQEPGSAPGSIESSPGSIEPPPVTDSSPSSSTLTCPESGYVDCMPGPGTRPNCTQEALNWYTKNCPDFKGVAY